MAWSAIVLGLVRKKKARVRWKRQMEVMMVLAEMSAMMGDGRESFREDANGSVVVSDTLVASR